MLGLAQLVHCPRSQLRGALGDLPLCGHLRLEAVLPLGCTLCACLGTAASFGSFLGLSFCAEISYVSLSGVTPDGVSWCPCDGDPGWLLVRSFWVPVTTAPQEGAVCRAGCLSVQCQDVYLVWPGGLPVPCPPYPIPAGAPPTLPSPPRPGFTGKGRLRPGLL